MDTETTKLITVRLLLFAQYRELLGEREREVRLSPDTTPRQALTTLSEGNETLQRLQGAVRFLVNGQFASGDDPLEDGDELAFVPPVAGGAECT